MSFPTTVYLSEEQIIETSSTQKMPLGTRGCASDGRIFRYAQAGGTALGQYKLCISAAQGPASTATDQKLYSPYAVASTIAQIYLSTIALPVLSANYFKDGYLMIESTDTAVCQICPIDSNEALNSATAAAGTAAAANTVWLKPPGFKKLGDTSTGLVKLVANPYKLVVVSTDANGPGFPVGVTPIGVTANYYFWIQTWGPTLAHAGEGVASIDKQPGFPVAWSTGSTGGVGGLQQSTGGNLDPAVTDSGFSSYNRVGTLITTAPAASFYHMINLTIAP